MPIAIAKIFIILHALKINTGEANLLKGDLNMYKKSIFLVFIILLGFIFTSSTFAQRNSYKRIFNPATVETITGEVLSVDTYKYNKSSGYGGVHLLVKTDKETIKVHVGPVWFLEDNNFTVNVNDKVEIKGSRVTYNEEEVIIGSNIKNGDKSLALRDDDGIPYWSGWYNK